MLERVDVEDHRGGLAARNRLCGGGFRVRAGGSGVGSGQYGIPHGHAQGSRVDHRHRHRRVLGGQVRGLHRARHLPRDVDRHDLGRAPGGCGLVGREERAR